MILEKTFTKTGRNLRSIEETVYSIPPQELESFFLGYMELENTYRCAIREVSTKLEVLDDEFQARDKRNPIHSIQSRLKSPDSIAEKLQRKGFPVNLESAREHLTDIAGIRVICSYIDDIYTIAELLKSQDDIVAVKESDYISKPKKNGYRSLHLVVKVPVFFSRGKEWVPVEIQIRTIAMDFWASLEHQLRYKAEGSVPRQVMTDLKECAETISDTDRRMQEIYYQLRKTE